MNVRAQVGQVKEWFRQSYSGKLDSISAIKQRNAEFDRLRDSIRQSGTDSLSHFGNEYTHEGGLSLQQNPDEFASLCLYLKEHRPYTNYMEIGSASGGTCLVLCREVGFTNIISVDDGSHPRAPEQKKNFSQLPNFKQFLGDSHSAAAKSFLESNLEGKLDVAFIDGDHSYEGVWQDVELTLPFCRPGTLVIFHDTIACDGVQKTWQRCAEEKLLKPLAEYIGDDRPLGIGIGSVI
ncbi:MAG: class I SAM-dependent methyltransferase [Pyrinomonadaceae bacterium]